MTISPSSLFLTGHITRTLGEGTIQKCANANSEKDITSLWGQIKDFFLGTHKEDAKLAIFHLANAESMEQQFSAFNELTRYVDPAYGDTLKWNLSDHDVLDFEVGGHRFPTASDTPEFMKQCPTLSLDDSCRLLLTLRHQGNNVLTELYEAGVQLGALALGPTNPILLRICQNQLREMPALLDALQVLGFHRNDANGDLGVDIGATVKDLAYQNRPETWYAETCARNAEQLVKLATTIKSRD